MCQVKNYTYLTGLVLIWGETTRFEIAAAAVHVRAFVCVCVGAHLCVYYWNVLTVLRPLRGTRAGRQKRLLVLETIFSYPTRAREELLHKNTSIRERASQRGGGGEETGGRTGSMNGRETVNSFYLSLRPPLSVCLSVRLFLFHLVPDPVSVRAVQIGCSCGEGSYGPLTGLLFPPVTHTHAYSHTHTRCLETTIRFLLPVSVYLLYLTISNLAGKTVVLSRHLNGVFWGKNWCKMYEINENVTIFKLLLYVCCCDYGRNILRKTKTSCRILKTWYKSSQADNIFSSATMTDQ